MGATMQKSNREEGIISSDSYYFYYIITVNENSYVQKLKDMTFFKGATSLFAYLEKSSLVFQVHNLHYYIKVSGIPSGNNLIKMIRYPHM